MKGGAMKNDQKLYRRHRWMKKLMIVVAAAPLFQLSQCATGVAETLFQTANGLPAAYFGVVENLIFYPARLALGGSSSSSSGSSGI
jgi:hypothetical protein